MTKVVIKLSDIINISFNIDPKVIPQSVRQFCSVSSLDISSFISYALGSDPSFLNNPCNKLVEFLQLHPQVSSAIFDLLRNKE